MAPALVVSYFNLRSAQSTVGGALASAGVGALLGPWLAARAYDRWDAAAVPFVSLLSAVVQLNTYTTATVIALGAAALSAVLVWLAPRPDSARR